MRFFPSASYILDLVICILSSHSEGFLSDAAKLQRKWWKSRKRGGFVLFGEFDVKFAWKVWTFEDIVGPFHVDTFPFNQKLRLLCFPPRNMDVYPKWFFSSKPTGLFSRCQIGCHGNLKELRDDGWFWVYWETATFSLPPNKQAWQQIIQKCFWYENQALWYPKMYNFFKVFICLYTHFLSHCVDAFAVHVKRGSCNKMYLINNKPIHTNICNNTLKKRGVCRTFFGSSKNLLKKHYFLNMKNILIIKRTFCGMERYHGF